MRVLDEAETSKILVLRSSVSIALIASAAIVAAFSYILLTANEAKMNNSKYNSVSEHMLRVISENFGHKDLEILATAKSMAYNHPNNDSWPQVHMPGFYDTAKIQLKQSGLHQLIFMPIVKPIELPEFEQYMYDYFESEPATATTAETAQATFGFFGVYAKDSADEVYHDTSGQAVLYDSKYDIIAPALQVIYDDSSKPKNLLGFNVHSEESIGPAIDAVIDCIAANNFTFASEGCGRVSACVHLDESAGLARHIEHLAVIIQPILLKQEPRKLVGFVAGSIDWQLLIKNSMPETVDSVDVVVSYGEEAFTFNCHHAEVTIKGSEDLHESRYDSHARSVYVYSNSKGHAHLEPLPGLHTLDDKVYKYHYKVTIYPTQHFYEGTYSSDMPLYVSIASGSLIIFCSAIFFLYDVLVSRASSRKNAVLDTKRRFVRFISHEIRTPLNSVHLGLEALYDELSKLAMVLRGSSGSPPTPFTALETLGASLDSWLELAMEMKGNSESAVDVLNDLLNYDKIEMGTLRLEFSSVPIWQIVAKCTQTFQMQARQKNVDLTLHGACWDPPKGEDQDQQKSHIAMPAVQYDSLHVVGDTGRLSQVLRNLISNALKFTPVLGGVDVSAEWVPDGLSDAAAPAVPADQAALVHRPRVGSIRIAVTDSGAGLSPEQLAEICTEGVQFNANQLQAGQGSGLGLFISKGLVELHGGKLTVTSEGLGKGATFTVELPLYQDPTAEDSLEHSSACVGDIEMGEAPDDLPAPQDATITYTRLPTHEHPTSSSTQPPPPPAVAAAVPTTRKVLVVDDAPSNRKMLIRLLTARGYHCEQAEDGQLALDVYQEALRRGECFEAIVMDYEMPVMNGPTAAKKLRELGCTTLIVGVTGNLLPEDVTYYKNQGANAVLGKPLNMVQFEEMVNGCKF